MRFKGLIFIKFQIFGYVRPQVFQGSAQLVHTLASVPKQRADLTVQGYVSLKYRALHSVLRPFPVVFIQSRLQAHSIYGFCLSASILFKKRSFLLWCSPAAFEHLLSWPPGQSWGCYLGSSNFLLVSENLFQTEMTYLSQTHEVMLGTLSQLVFPEKFGVWPFSGLL